MECAAKEYSYIAVDGAENCIAALATSRRETYLNALLKCSMCAGSCIGGPVMEKYHRTPVRDYIRVSSYAGKEDFAARAKKRRYIKFYRLLRLRNEAHRSRNYGNFTPDGENKARRRAELRYLRI